MRRTVVIDEANAGRRLDVYLRQLLPSVGLGTIMKWARKGAVRVNGKRARPSARLARGDELSLPGPPSTAAPMPAPRRRAAEGEYERREAAGPRLAVLYEDDDLLAVDKPAGLAVHGGSGHEHDSLLALAERHLDAAGAPPGHRPGLVQRLDRDVSGVVVIGKSAPVLRALAAAVRDGAAQKTYLALVDGRLAPPAGTIELALRVTDASRRDQPKVVPDPAGAPAYTEYMTREQMPDAALLEVRLRTGRMHQIRAHLRAIGHPILGDQRYGSATRNAELRRHLGLSRLFLHAAELRLLHPRDGRPLQFASPLPADLARVLSALRSTRR